VFGCVEAATAHSEQHAPLEQSSKTSDVSFYAHQKEETARASFFIMLRSSDVKRLPITLTAWVKRWRFPLGVSNRHFGTG
jgi:hypothetical protein